MSFLLAYGLHDFLMIYAHEGINLYINLFNALLSVFSE